MEMGNIQAASDIAPVLLQVVGTIAFAISGALAASALGMSRPTYSGGG